jgi:hypothetical protein
MLSRSPSRQGVGGVRGLEGISLNRDLRRVVDGLERVDMGGVRWRGLGHGSGRGTIGREVLGALGRILALDLAGRDDGRKGTWWYGQIYGLG